ncbi:hypothetical protein C8F01DRAFT_1252991 [Mycena amicta]|nr:hypothetical protein C8F01DRAFT_1252991 [Mycena amicta]
MTPGRPPLDLEQALTVTSDIGPTRIPVGSSMTIQELCTWIRCADSEIQNALLTDVCWWAESGTVLKHQFLTLKFQYAGAVHELILERAGKVIMDPFRRAIDKATFKSTTLEQHTSFHKGHQMLFGLLTDKNIAPKGSFCFDAFVDFLDHKWRGPYPRLLDLARYVQEISAQETRYSLTSANCYWFARLLSHTLALRHYAFPTIASSVEPRKYVLPRTPDTLYGTAQIHDDDWRYHDPSSTGLVFRFLRYEEWRNGFLVVRRGIIISAIILSCILVGPGGYGIYRIIRMPRPQGEGPTTHAVIAVVVLLTIMAIGVVYFLIARRLRRQIIELITYHLTRRKTTRVLDIFDQGMDPESIRGDYIPVDLPLTRMKIGPQVAVPFYVVQRETMFIHRRGRKMPTAWQYVSGS